jgi:hypothetical protein
MTLWWTEPGSGATLPVFNMDVTTHQLDGFCKWLCLYVLQFCHLGAGDRIMTLSQGGDRSPETHSITLFLACSMHSRHLALLFVDTLNKGVESVYTCHHSTSKLWRLQKRLWALKVL